MLRSGDLQDDQITKVYSKGIPFNLKCGNSDTSYCSEVNISNALHLARSCYEYIRPLVLKVSPHTGDSEATENLLNVKSLVNTH